MPDGGVLCATTPPPNQDAGDNHFILCHLPLATLRTLQPISHERLMNYE
jgi:hypothetical protein